MQFPVLWPASLAQCSCVTDMVLVADAGSHCVLSFVHSRNLVFFPRRFAVPRPLTLDSGGGGVVGATPMSFSKMAAKRCADRTEILHILWSILCATFDEKIEWVRSGQGAMMS